MYYTHYIYTIPVHFGNVALFCDHGGGGGGGGGDGWSNLCHGFGFVCQERILKTLPGPG